MLFSGLEETRRPCLVFKGPEGLFITHRPLCKLKLSNDSSVCFYYQVSVTLRDREQRKDIKHMIPNAHTLDPVTIIGNRLEKKKKHLKL